DKQTNKTGVYRGGEVTQVSASTAPAGNAGDGNPAADAPPPAANSAPAPTASSTSACEKGWLWPFVRESGDCPTGADKQTNKTGVYRGGEGTQVSATPSPAG